MDKQSQPRWSVEGIERRANWRLRAIGVVGGTAIGILVVHSAWLALAMFIAGFVAGSLCIGVVWAKSDELRILHPEHYGSGETRP